MNVKKVSTGKVFSSSSGYGFYVLVTTSDNTVSDFAEEKFSTQKAAKQAMRERVAFLKKKHCI